MLTANVYMYKTYDCTYNCQFSIPPTFYTTRALKCLASKVTSTEICQIKKIFTFFSPWHQLFCLVALLLPFLLLLLVGWLVLPVDCCFSFLLKSYNSVRVAAVLSCDWCLLLIVTSQLLCCFCHHQLIIKLCVATG